MVSFLLPKKAVLKTQMVRFPLFKGCTGKAQGKYMTPSDLFPFKAFVRAANVLKRPFSRNSLGQAVLF